MWLCVSKTKGRILLSEDLLSLATKIRSAGKEIHSTKTLFVYAKIKAPKGLNR